MNQEMIVGILKPLASALVAYLAASHVLFDAATWNIIVTSLVAAGLAAWSGWQNRQAGLVASVDKLAKQENSPVKAIIVAATPAGAALANAMPGMTTVIEGTSAARDASAQGSG